MDRLDYQKNIDTLDKNLVITIIFSQRGCKLGEEGPRVATGPPPQFQVIP